MSTTSPSHDENAYAPPLAEVRDLAVERSHQFYVVSSSKYFLLFFLTVGLYQIYWFYRHWAQHKRYRKLDLWPIPRAIFSIFFTHSLAREIDRQIGTAAPRFQWSPSDVATPFVVVQVGSNIVGQLTWRGIGVPITDWVGIVLLLPLAWLGFVMQRAANVACDDPDGASNARFTIANWTWMAVGSIAWLLMLLGIMLTEEPL